MCSDEYQEPASTHPRARALWNEQEWWFQQDNAPSHVSNKSLAWFKEQEVNLLVWPPASPAGSSRPLRPMSSARRRPLSITCGGSLSGPSMNSHRQTQVVSLGNEYVKKLQACVAAEGSWFYPVEPSPLAA